MVRTGTNAKRKTDARSNLKGQLLGHDKTKGLYINIGAGLYKLIVMPICMVLKL